MDLSFCKCLELQFAPDMCRSVVLLQVERLLEVLLLLAIGCKALLHIGATCLPQELQDQRVSIPRCHQRLAS